MLAVLCWALVYSTLTQMPCVLTQTRYFLPSNPAHRGVTVIHSVVSLELGPLELDRSFAVMWQMNHRQFTESCYLFIYKNFTVFI